MVASLEVHDPVTTALQPIKAELKAVRDVITALRVGEVPQAATVAQLTAAPAAPAATTETVATTPTPVAPATPVEASACAVSPSGTAPAVVSGGEFLQVTVANWRAIFLRAPQAVIDAFAAKAQVLNDAGITRSSTRLAYALANVEHECSGFLIRNLTENINYSPERMAAVWPNRFGSAGDVRAKYGVAPGWRKKVFADIYGNRMGNRPGTNDGSMYIGRGGPQITGRGGYQQVGDRCRLDLVNHLELATAPENQPAILAAFWTWKDLNQWADDEDFKGCVKAWNGGTNGMRDRLEQMRGNDPVIGRLGRVSSVVPALNGS